MAKTLSNEEYYERLVERVYLKGGKVISAKYEKAIVKMRFSCSEGHIFEMTPNDVHNGYWCRKCGNYRTAQKRRLSLKDVRKEIESRGGTLLSEDYVNTGTALQLLCENGHNFRKDLDHIRRGQWCNKCSGKLSKEDIYQELVEIAKTKGGQVISKEYKNGKTDMEFECTKGHRFQSRPTHIRKSGTWCNTCSSSMTDSERQERHAELQGIAKAKGGALLSGEYLGVNEKHLWCCDKGHRFQSVASSIKQGTWCRECGGTAPLTIKALQDFAEKKGGKLLSKEYKDARTDYYWQCAEGHKWLAAPGNVMRENGTWCNVCSSGVNERVCRKYFELLFRAEFKKKRPAWLKISDRSRLELDGYSEEFGIAFEYQGQQHYTAVSFSKNHTSSIDKQKQRDQIKRDRCKQEGVVLIEVPYTVNGRFEEFIRAECNRLGVTVPRLEMIQQNELKDAFLNSSVKFKEFKKLVAEKGGRVVANQSYSDSKTPIEVICGECGYQWGINLGNLRNGKWCKPCGIKRRSQARRKVKNSSDYGDYAL